MMHYDTSFELWFEFKAHMGSIAYWDERNRAIRGDKSIAHLRRDWEEAHAEAVINPYDDLAVAVDDDCYAALQTAIENKVRMQRAA